MDIYTRKSRWKIYLAIAGFLILLVSLFYTNYLAQQLAEGERVKAQLLARAWESLASSDNLDQDITIQLEIIKSNTDIPALVVNDRAQIEFAVNFGRDLPGNEAYFERQLATMKASGPAPIEMPDNTIYYQQSRTLTLLTYYPILQLVLLGIFIGIGYLLFSSARRSEQNQVWAGMAKETAHQLGTPISAIVGWIEHLRVSYEADESLQDVLGELDKDVSRLNLIADRFSKIGSAPELEKIDLYPQLEDIKNYMSRRASRKVKFDFPGTDFSPLYIKANLHLFAWVLENLMRNALDATEGKGTISARVYEDNNYVSIDVSDTGKGIPTNKFKTVFQPGFTTKKRGWGLGLSLAKRIIESYHSGKIFVKNSVINQGTTFTIKLPKFQ
ncbi:MAG: HAMP domain-containing sensor histidine kinase [Bacteroidota bacterium]